MKNFRNVTIVLVAAFLIVTVRGEMRDLRPGVFGGLYHKELPEAPVPAKPVEVVREEPAPVPDAASADPMLIEPMTRAQWLDDEIYNAAQTETTTTTATAAAASAPPFAPTLQGGVEGDARVAIVGGAGGIAVVKEPRRQPVLSGGFGRQ